jgi:hypothetical protein
VNLTGDYRIEATVWLNSFGPWPGANAVSTGAGTSQMFGLGSGYSSGTNWRAGATTGGGTGTWFASSIEGGFGTSTTIRDYSAFTGSGAVAANFVTAASAYAAGNQDNFTPYYQSISAGLNVDQINEGKLKAAQDPDGAGFQSGTSTAGTPVFQWRKYIIERVGDTITWSIDSTRIATLTSTTSAPLTLNGGTQLTYFDPTTTAAAKPDLVFALVADYKISAVPEPGSLAVIAAAACGLLRRSRNPRRPAAT